MLFLDTHAAVFLHAGELTLFGKEALSLLETEELALSPMAFLELEYLREVGRINFGAERIASELGELLGLRLLDRDWAAVAARACSLSWTRDPFDRFIVAQAEHEGCRLLSKDRIVQEHCELAFW